MNSKKVNVSSSLNARFNALINHLTPKQDPQRCLLIALSGGVDSVVLLSLAAQWRKSHDGSVRAIYIDHGLQAQSAQWSTECAAYCDALHVDFQAIKVTVNLDSGLSPEAAARDARYDALEQSLAVGEFLCTAHHANDQAETLLLQLCRGAGVHGLAAMPTSRAFGNGYLLRPLLEVSGDEITRYAQEHSLSWCEDPSNKDLRYDRNFVRHQVMPMLDQRWSQVATSVTRSATHCAEAASLADDLAQIDLGGHESSSKLDIAKLNLLPDIRRRNALRYWIKSNGFLAPSQTQLLQIISDTLEAGADSHGRVSFGEASVGRYRDEIFIGRRESFEPIADFEYTWDDPRQRLYLPELDWHLDATEHAHLSEYAGRRLIVRNRRGGERWRAPGAHHSTSVKTLLQERGVASWQRSRLVFVFCSDQLIDICGPDFAL